MTDDEKKEIHYELKRFRDKVEDLRRSLEPRQFSQEDYINSMADGAHEVFLDILSGNKQSETHISQWYRRREQEFMMFQQEHNRKLNYLRSLEGIDKFLTILEKNNRWDGIQLILIFSKEGRTQELWVAEQLVAFNRFDDLSNLAKLRKQGRWADIQTVCNLAYYGNWNEVTIRLAEMTTSPESRNLFNEPIFTGELKDMYQHYLFLKENNRIDEANKVYNEIFNIVESRTKKLNAAQIDVLKTDALRVSNSINPPFQASSQDVESASNEKLTKSFYDECANRFIEEYHLLCGETPGDDGKYPVYIWEEKLCRYRQVENLTELYSRLKKLSRNISSEMGYDRPTLLTDQKTKEIVDSLIYSPELAIEEKGIKQPREEQVFFWNGYYDLREGKFYKTDTTSYFHLFCLPYDYDDNVGEPAIFDAMLANMFNGDEKKIELSYQIIGAILSDVTRLKSLFVFKGVPHGGKSTLGDLIASFLAENTVESFPNMDSIETSKIKPYERNRKLLYIDDAPDKVWNSSTVSYLKSRSRGLSGANAVVFKILFCTNYAISCNTEEDKKSLEARLVILSFDNDMKEFNKNHDTSIIQRMIRCHFELERQAIVKKALEQFKVVLDRGGEFTKLDDNLSNAIRVSSSPVIPRSAAKENTTRQTISDKNEAVCDLIRKNYERTDDPERFTTPTSILDFIIKKMPDTNGKEGEVGKVVRFVFGNDVTTGNRTKDGKTRYKITCIDPQQ